MPQCYVINTLSLLFKVSTEGLLQTYRDTDIAHVTATCNPQNFFRLWSHVTRGWGTTTFFVKILYAQ
jgi:hypothetical protein